MVLVGITTELPFADAIPDGPETVASSLTALPMVDKFATFAVHAEFPLQDPRALATAGLYRHTAFPQSQLPQRVSLKPTRQ